MPARNAANEKPGTRYGKRGDAGYQGTVTSVGEPLQGKDYRWIEVRHPKGTKHVWPSNRLG